MEFRVGINLGDVIEEQGNIYGDGVNVATIIRYMDKCIEEADQFLKSLK
jgi:class 3 adenylate cyclase